MAIQHTNFGYFYMSTLFLCSEQCPDLNENGENNIALRNRGLRGEILYTGVRELGSVATYECSGNLVPVGGDLMRTCIENITNIGCPIWDDPEPRCVGKCILYISLFPFLVSSSFAVCTA